MPTFIDKTAENCWEIDSVMLDHSKKAAEWMKEKLKPGEYFIGIQEFHVNSRYALDRFRRKFGHDLRPGFRVSVVEQLLAEMPKDQIVFRHQDQDITATQMRALIDACDSIATDYSLALAQTWRTITEPLK